MTSISGAANSPVVWDRSKPVKLPDDFDQPEAVDSAYSKFLQSESTGVPLIPVNRPDNVWGKIALPDGQVVTIYNGGSVESENALDVELPMHEGSEVARSQAILARYGGTLEITERNGETPMDVGSDVATLWSNILDNPALADRFLNSPRQGLLPDEWLPDGTHGDDQA